MPLLLYFAVTPSLLSLLLANRIPAFLLCSETVPHRFNVPCVLFHRFKPLHV